MQNRTFEPCLAAKRVILISAMAHGAGEAQARTQQGGLSLGQQRSATLFLVSLPPVTALAGLAAVPPALACAAQQRPRDLLAAQVAARLGTLCALSCGGAPAGVHAEWDALQLLRRADGRAIR
jgi:hypothetical protein